MTWTNGEIAIASIGASCQTAFQVNNVAARVFSALGFDAGRKQSSYFDWLICPPSAAISLLDSGVGFPQGIDEITLNNGMPMGRHGELFWHYFRDGDGAINVPQTGPETLSKLEHMAKNAIALSNARRVLFVWSNTQNNLDATAQKHGGDFHLTANVAHEIIAVCSRFAREQPHVLFITQEGRWEPFDELPGSTVRVFEPYDRSWHGDIRQWEPAVHDAVSRMHHVGIS